MNKRKYNNIIFGTLKQQKTIKDEPLTMVRKICKNMGVALPQGDCKEVLETLRAGGFMVWKKCSEKEARAAANSGIVTIAISNNAIAIMPSNEQSTIVMSNNQSDTSPAVMTLRATPTSNVEFYSYGSGVITTDGSPMNYRIVECYQTKNDCYKRGKAINGPKGIVVHSTAANNTYIKRYVDYAEEFGTNANGNHWNRSGVNKMVHAFVGYDKNQKIAIANTLPYEYACWGVGSGINGSYNDSHIQFEICEDATDSSSKNCQDYFNEAVFGAAVEYCAYLCKLFALPYTSIVSHKESYNLGYGSNHGDPESWLTKFGKTMDAFRNEVRNLL